MDDGEMVAGGLVEAGELPPELLDQADHDLDPGALLVRGPVGGAAAEATGVRRDHRHGAPLDHKGEDGVAVIAPITGHGAGREPFEQRYGLWRIARLAGGQDEAQGVAEAVGEGVQLAGEPAP